MQSERWPEVRQCSALCTRAKPLEFYSKKPLEFQARERWDKNPPPQKRNQDKKNCGNRETWSLLEHSRKEVKVMVILGC